MSAGINDVRIVGFLRLSTALLGGDFSVAVAAVQRLDMTGDSEQY
jgi:hypothetical protein